MLRRHKMDLGTKTTGQRLVAYMAVDAVTEETPNCSVPSLFSDGLLSSTNKSWQKTGS